MKAYDAAEELSKLIERHAKLKYPSSNCCYAWEAGCLVSVLKTMASQCPEALSFLEKEIEHHKKQVMCLENLGG
jgi:NRPS condensation-like uncharacterized protein